MLRFYIDVFAAFPRMAKIAMDRIVLESYLKSTPVETPADASSYYSVPTTADVAAYRGRSFCITDWSDLFYSPTGKNFEFTEEVSLFDEATLEAWGERRTAQRLERIGRRKEDRAAMQSPEDLDPAPPDYDSAAQPPAASSSS
jgi:hypothetical protein